VNIITFRLSVYQKYLVDIFKVATRYLFGSYSNPKRYLSGNLKLLQKYPFIMQKLPK